LPIRRNTSDLGKLVGARWESSVRAISIVLLALSLSAACALAQEDGVPGAQRPSNRWRIAFEGTAMSNGTIDFLISPVGGNPISVSVPVVAGQTDKDVATAAHGAFATALGSSYKIKADRGADIHLGKPSRKQPNFGLRLVRLTAQDVKVDLDRE
jgi:hypothetical protein